MNEVWDTIKIILIFGGGAALFYWCFLLDIHKKLDDILVRLDELKRKH